MEVDFNIVPIVDNNWLLGCCWCGKKKQIKKKKEEEEDDHDDDNNNKEGKIKIANHLSY